MASVEKKNKIAENRVILMLPKIRHNSFDVRMETMKRVPALLSFHTEYETTYIHRYNVVAYIMRLIKFTLYHLFSKHKLF
ncbi:hypothetical protein DICVIV_14135 [Dictyocaulus viviparus]|uniref:Uncharacterized protein n=1 Tax=Dictyocaulus viviparus TaxID=29172 RepID=A0A0D8X5Z0_DICVI|nr:hypothetical protein DICVIV_14135 [Dictyocaulus viviparus]